MSKDEREFLDKLRATSVEAAAEIMAGLQRLKGLQEELANDGIGDPTPRPRLGDFFYQLARAELEHATTILRLGNAQADLVFGHIRQLARRSRGERAVPVLDLIEAGDDHRASFEIRNPFPADGDVRFEVDALCDQSGRTLDPEVRPEVSLVAGSRMLPYSTATVQVVVDRHHVPPGASLFGSVAVFLSADIEKQVAQRSLKVRRDV